MSKPKELLRQLQQLPEFHKKALAWVITIAVGIALLAWWIPHAREQLSGNNESPGFKEQLQIQELQHQLQQIPVTIPNGEQ